MRLIILVLLSTLTLPACNSNTTTTTQPTKPDTILTVKTFVNFPGDSIRFAPVYRITKDTVVYIDKDSVTKVKSQSRDTTYYIPINGKYEPTIKGSVYEGEDLTKGLQTLSKWVQDHKQYWPKKDTIKPAATKPKPPSK